MRGLTLLGCAALLTASCSDAFEQPRHSIDPYSKQAFSVWLESAGGSENRTTQFADFEEFLDKQGVGDVLPVWQLLRTDAHYAARCDGEAFAMPPREKWLAIVPALRLVRDQVVPVVGRVEVSSAWRSDELNECINGASRSKHLAFSAIDLIAPESEDKRAMFDDLCAMHREVGARTSMGLGAYFDPLKPQQNAHGRFHIDAAGHRTWGYDYTRQSSGCVTMAKIHTD